MKQSKYHSTTLDSFHSKKQLIEMFAIGHPLQQQLSEIKINKCLQHGHLRQYNSVNL